MSKHKKIIVGIIISCIAALIIAGFSYYSYIYFSYQKISYVDSNDKNEEENSINEDLEKEENTIETDELKEDDIMIDEDKKNEEEETEEKIEFKEVEGITNILLVGTDARDYEKKSRSDTIMILTIDDIHKKLKLTSIMRDTYAQIPGHGEQKINHSFVYGKADLLMKTIEKNFDIKLDKYAIINFMGFKDLVDAIGGLDIEVNEEQRKELNRCIIGLENYQENFFGEEPNFLRETGMQNLDGQQVLAYARMRHIENGCYSRDERQRNVVNMIIDKLKETSILKYPQVATTLMPCVKTNIDFNQALDLAYTIYKIDNFNVEQLQIPVVKLSHSMLYKDKGWVLLIDKKNNTKVLHDFVFEDIPLDESKYSKFNYASSQYYYEPEIKETNPIEEENNNNGSENSNENSIQEVDKDTKGDINAGADNQETNNQEINENLEEDKDGDKENLNSENNAENNEDDSINSNNPKEDKNNSSVESEEDNGGIETEDDSEENKNDQNTEKNDVNDQNAENVDNNKDDEVNNKENTENKDDTLNVNETEQSNNNDEINNETELENTKNTTNNKEQENKEQENKDNDNADIIDTTNNSN